MTEATRTVPLALTPLQVRVLTFIAGYIKEEACSPTQAEIAAFLGVHRTTARDHILRLADRGALTTECHGKSRCMRLTQAAVAFVDLRAKAS